ncbi:MAG: hypothetical protein J6S53_03305 [Lentisphaeria bacterium]|nr:hypothetical protein [Lentisphaeria bacterium]
MPERKIKNQDTAALKICEDARAQLILHHPFVGRLGVQIPFVPVQDCRIHTIATNGKVIYINPRWVCSMPPVTMKGWIAHTIWTAALCHSFRRGEIEPGKFDLASDLEVYTLLCAEEVPMVHKTDFYEMFPNHLPVEEIIAKLPDQQFHRYSNCDVHLYSCGPVSIPEKLPGEANEPSIENKNFPEDKKGKSMDGDNPAEGDNNTENKKKGKKSAGNKEGKKADCDPSGTEESRDCGEQMDADCECDPAMQEIWRQRIIEAGQNYKMVYGSLPGELTELVEFFTKSKTNRIQLLRRYLSLCTGGESHWLPPASRFIWHKLYLPSRRDPKLEIVVAVDTSGSISEEDFQKIFSDIVNIVQGFPNYKITLIQCDCEIQDVQEFSKDKPFCKNTQITLKGRGGTNFIPVFEYIKEKKIQPKVLLYYTDGCGAYPEKKPEYPVIWLLTKKVSVPWGKKIIL